jgi:hypothetical protein
VHGGFNDRRILVPKGFPRQISRQRAVPRVRSIAVLAQAYTGFSDRKVQPSFSGHILHIMLEVE